MVAGDHGMGNSLQLNARQCKLAGALHTLHTVGFELALTTQGMLWMSEMD